MNELEILKNVPLFSQMDDQDLAGVHAIVTHASFRAGEVILREGEPGDLFYVLTAGKVEVLITDASGAEKSLQVIEPGGFFGELSMLTGKPRTARIRATESAQALGLDRDQFFAFLVKHPHAAISVLTELGERLRQTDLLLRSTVSRNVNELDEERMSFGERIADGVTNRMGSLPFIVIQTIILVGWIGLNITAWVKSWDPYPFILLNLALSFQAAYAAPFIMMSQNRQSTKDRLAAEIDHQVNTKAELGVGILLRRLDDLERCVLQMHDERRRISDGK